MRANGERLIKEMKVEERLMERMEMRGGGYERNILMLILQMRKKIVLKYAEKSVQCCHLTFMLFYLRFHTSFAYDTVIYTSLFCF